MHRAKNIESFNNEFRYKNAIFMESSIGKKLYKYRIKLE